MKKQIFAAATTLVMVTSMATSALAVTTPYSPAAQAAGYGYCGGGYGIMWDQDGNFLDKETFEGNLDKLIEDGFIFPEDRDYFLDRYDWCSSYGGGAAGARGGRGLGRGMGCGMRRGW